MVATLTFKLMIRNSESAILKFQSQPLGEGCFYECPVHRGVLHYGCTVSQRTWQGYEAFLKNCMMTGRGVHRPLLSECIFNLSVKYVNPPSRSTLTREQLAER